MIQHIVNISGGKDSAATYLLAIERGKPFRAVFADTGHEHEFTYEFIARLHERAGGPVVETVRADFGEQIARKREFVAANWPAHGVPAAQVERAIAALQPTGNPFLDLCIWKGRFPSTRVRFCTPELKSKPIDDQVTIPALRRGPVIRWQGERREESLARANLPMFQRVRWTDPLRTMVIYRPIIAWAAADVFALHARHGLDPNPLYRLGASRVGCLPCIMARKSEIAIIAARFPEAVEKLIEWEALVSAASKRGAATFFGPDKTPRGAALAKSDKQSTDYPVAAEVFDWSRTARGGRQLSFLDEFDAGAECVSEYGLCE